MEEKLCTDYQEITRKASILKMLSNPTRLCIITTLLQEGKCNVSSLRCCGDYSQSIISQHLSRLKDRGIVASERKGKEVYYCIINREVADVVRSLLMENY